MTGQEATLVGLARILESAAIPYMVIGGHANAVWGEPRATLDIDVTIWLGESRVAALVEDLSPLLRPRVADPEAFVRDTRVLPVETDDGLAVDLIFGLLPFEEHAIERAVPVKVDDQEVRFCTAEDLVLLKIVSTRKRDLDDVRGVVRAQAGQLDLAYLEPRIEELADLLGRPEMLAFWRRISSLADRFGEGEGE